MTAHDERSEAPDVDRLARSMLLLHGSHDDEDDHPAGNGPGTGSWSKAPDFAEDPLRAAAVREATARDRERYLNAGLTPVDCRFCHATVAVKKVGPEYTAVQWNSDASRRCATFAELRANGGDSSRSRSCPRLSDSIKHAVAEGCLDEVSTAPSPGDG
jgi:cytochrome c551/c552